MRECPFLSLQLSFVRCHCHLICISMSVYARVQNSSKEPFIFFNLFTMGHSKQNITSVFHSLRQHKRKTFDTIPDFGFWQAFVLFFTGSIGGIFTAIAGSGVDICSTSVLSLLFRCQTLKSSRKKQV